MIRLLILDEFKNCAVLLSLHAILTPSTRMLAKGSSKTGHKEYWKPSIKDSQNSFLYLVADEGEVSKCIAEKRDKYTKFGLSLQPLTIVVGNSYKDIKKIIVIYDEVLYTFNSVCKAIDICFKIFQCFNLEYPKESQLVWLFIQKYFFKITSKYDLKIPALSSLISEIDN